MLSDNDLDIRYGADQGGWPRITATRAAMLLRAREPLTRATVDRVFRRSGGGSSFATEAGHAIEPVVLKHLCIETGLALDHLQTHLPTIAHSDTIAIGPRHITWAAATPDGIWDDGFSGKYVLESKLVGEKQIKRDGWDKKVPMKVRNQVDWQMVVTGADYGAIGLAHTGTTLCRWVISADAEHLSQIWSTTKNWYQWFMNSMQELGYVCRDTGNLLYEFE